MTVDGSDCPSGKEQFTADGARAKVKAMRAQGFRNVRKYRCMLCSSLHVGNKRRADKKNDIQRRR